MVSLRNMTKTFLVKTINILVFNRFGLYINYLFKKCVYSFYLHKNLKLNLGCGGAGIEGFINIDHRLSRATNMLLDIKRLPFRKSTVEVIEAHHVIEHISHVKVGIMLDEWWRVLKHDGKLIIECPNVDETMKEYLAGNEYRIFNIYGLQRYKGDFHLFGYNAKRLKELLEKHRFYNCKFEEPTDFHKDEEPCLRMTCKKNYHHNPKKIK